jgi:hypothetical protein
MSAITVRASHSSQRPGTTASCSNGPLGGGREPSDAGEHRVGDRGGNPAVRVGQHFREEERVARREPVQVGGRVPARHARRRIRGKAAQGDPPHPGTAESAEQTAQRRSEAERVVAVGRQQHRGQRGDAPAEEAQDVQGGVVGPVDVLDHQQGRLPSVGQLVVQRGEHGVLVTCFERLGEGRGLPADGVAQRPQRAQAQEVLARS